MNNTGVKTDFLSWSWHVCVNESALVTTVAHTLVLEVGAVLRWVEGVAAAGLSIPEGTICPNVTENVITADQLWRCVGTWGEHVERKSCRKHFVALQSVHVHRAVPR